MRIFEELTWQNARDRIKLSRKCSLQKNSYDFHVIIYDLFARDRPDFLDTARRPRPLPAGFSPLDQTIKNL